MKNWSIKAKLILLAAVSLVMICAMGFLNYHTVRQNEDSLAVTRVYIPGIRSITLMDMYHDGIQGIVFKAFYAVDNKDLELQKQVANDLKEMVENMRREVKNLDALPFSVETHKQVQQTDPKVEAYINEATEIVGLAFAGRMSNAKSKTDSFNTAFKNLEEEMEKIGELIVHDSEQFRDDAIAKAGVSKKMGWIGLICAFGFSISISFLNIRSVMSTLSGAVSSLENVGRKIAEASRQSADSAGQLSEASTGQAASLQQTMASVEEISAMVNQNAESANKAQAAVNTNQRFSEAGSRNVDDMLSAIDEIRGANQEILSQMEISNKEFGEIVKIITEIGEKTDVINEIVFQTKLLSFNASVEAARAGEHGKGFAVVAEEVGNLAQMSGNAAKEITDMLSASIKKVNEIVDSTKTRVDRLIEVGRDKIAMGQSTAERCREALSQITENAQSMSSMVIEINHASKEQAQGIQEINKAISQLDQTTQQNTAVAQQSSAQADQLATESSVLGDVVQTLVRFLEGGEKSFAGPTRPQVQQPKAQVIPMPVKKTSSFTVADDNQEKQRARFPRA